MISSKVGVALCEVARVDKGLAFVTQAVVLVLCLSQACEVGTKFHSIVDHVRVSVVHDRVAVCLFLPLTGRSLSLSLSPVAGQVH